MLISLSHIIFISYSFYPQSLGHLSHNPYKTFLKLPLTLVPMASPNEPQLPRHARAMMLEKHIPNFYWARAASTTVYLMNQCTTNGVHELTPYKILVGSKVILKVFESIAYVHIPNEKRQKLNAKSEKCILVGYSSEQKGYKCLNPLTRAVRVGQDVVFDESTSWYEPDSTPSKPTKKELDVNSDNNIRPSPLPKDSRSSIELSGWHEPSSIPNTSQPWAGQR